MNEIKVVIGKNFGDEGKGQIVNDLCREAVCSGKSVVVVRHNGGAQAGHTVEEDGFRFVFHQLGSGSRQGAGVCWSHTFLPDLVKLGEEEEMFSGELDAAGSPCEPVPIYADGECRCTTIYDVLLNSLSEELRPSGRHGSCGMGIYEAVLRSRKEKDTIRLKDLEGKTPLEVTERLRQLRDGYVKERLGEICREWGPDTNLQPGSNEGNTCRLKENEWYRLIYDEQVLLNSADRMWENFNRYVILTDINRLLDGTDTVIFENAQGLLLDEDNQEYYPHLTPSHTGLYNIAAYLEGGGRLPDAEKSGPYLEVHYVTRTYVTRHGAGRLDHECRPWDIPFYREDRTNRPNRWQESLRYARHPSLEEFLSPILSDVAVLPAFGPFPTEIILDITHLDETGGRLLFHDGESDADKVGEYMKDRIQTPVRVKLHRRPDGCQTGPGSREN